MMAKMCGIRRFGRSIVTIAMALLLLWVGCVGLCVWTGPVYATSIIEVESMFFNQILHFGTNAPDAFKATNSGTNINGDTSNSKGSLQVLSFGYTSTDTGPLSTAQVAVIVDQEAVRDASIVPEVIGKALFYPNPARQQDVPRLGYQLSKNMDIEL